MIWCPRCEQGWVVKCRVRENGDLISVCEECDTVWKGRDPEKVPPFVFLEEYLSECGVVPLWSSLERLEPGVTG